MSLIEWTEELSVGVKELDSQHKLYFSIVNQLQRAIKLNIASDESGRTLHHLADYTVIHLNKEEELFSKYAYPDAANHITQHNFFRNKIADIIKDYNKGYKPNPDDLFKLCNDWFVSHIKNEDKKYTKFFNQNGLK